MVRFGFIQDVADEIFNGQGIEYIDEWLNQNGDDIKTLLQNVQKNGVGGQGDIISFKA